jgi:hypothetical protein
LEQKARQLKLQADDR